ncbi:MAG TPA: hypothetical protein DEV93_21230 [Chloroflexi bacterium]|nr:hypothetical protein [Chloroflexota bacterium]
MNFISRFLRSLSLLALGALALGSCGPSLTTPSSTDISGTWVSPGPAAGMTSITINLTQASDGSLTGTYTAIGTDPLQFCPATPPCAISSTVSGINTVLQVFFYMKDAGTFTGQVTGAGTMRGAMSRISATDAVQFTRP